MQSENSKIKLVQYIIIRQCNAFYFLFTEIVQYNGLFLMLKRGSVNLKAFGLISTDQKPYK